MPTYVLDKVKRTVDGQKVGDIVDQEAPTTDLDSLAEADKIIVADDSASDALKNLSPAQITTYLNTRLSLDADRIASGTLGTERLGGGTPDAQKILWGDGQWRRPFRVTHGGDEPSDPALGDYHLYPFHLYRELFEVSYPTGYPETNFGFSADRYLGWDGTHHYISIARQGIFRTDADGGNPTSVSTSVPNNQAARLIGDYIYLSEHDGNNELLRRYSKDSVTEDTTWAYTVSIESQGTVRDLDVHGEYLYMLIVGQSATNIDISKNEIPQTSGGTIRIRSADLVAMGNNRSLVPQSGCVDISMGAVNMQTFNNDLFQTRFIAGFDPSGSAAIEFDESRSTLLINYADRTFGSASVDYRGFRNGYAMLHKEGTDATPTYAVYRLSSESRLVRYDGTNWNDVS